MKKNYIIKSFVFSVIICMFSFSFVMAADYVKPDDFEKANQDAKKTITSLDKKIENKKKSITKQTKKFNTYKKRYKKTILKKISSYEKKYDLALENFTTLINDNSKKIDEALIQLSKAKKASEIDSLEAKIKELKLENNNLQADMEDDLEIYSNYISAWEEQFDVLTSLNLKKVTNLTQKAERRLKVLSKNAKVMKNIKSSEILYNYLSYEISVKTKNLETYTTIEDNIKIAIKAVKNTAKLPTNS